MTEQQQQHDTTDSKVGRFGIIRIDLVPDQQEDKQKEEINSIIIWLISLCSEKEKKEINGPGYNLTAIHTYYNATKEIRDKISNEIESSGIDHGVENSLYIIYRNAKELRHEDDDEDKPLVGGTPNFFDIIGFMSCYFEKDSIYIGYIYVIEKYRKQGVCKTVIRNLLTTLHTGFGFIPLIKTDVIARIPAIKLFLKCGFVFSRVNTES